jgi:cold shock protein
VEEPAWQHEPLKWFSDDKDFGFITPDAIAGDGFESLAEGTRVSYQASPGSKGASAAVTTP